MKRLKRFPQLDLRQQVRAARSSLSTREASHCSRAGPSGDPGGQLSEGCHWFVTDDKWGRSRSHHRLQRGRLPQRPAGERGGKGGNAEPNGWKKNQPQMAIFPLTSCNKKEQPCWDRGRGQEATVHRGSAVTRQWTNLPQGERAGGISSALAS